MLLISCTPLIGVGTFSNTDNRKRMIRRKYVVLEMIVQSAAPGNPNNRYLNDKILSIGSAFSPYPGSGAQFRNGLKLSSSRDRTLTHIHTLDYSTIMAYHCCPRDYIKSVDYPSSDHSLRLYSHVNIARVLRQKLISSVLRS